MALAARVRRRLRPGLPALADIWHVGATAVPDCLTKGDLDLVVRVDASDFAGAETYLAGLFRRNDASVHTREFAAFTDEACVPPLGIQLTVRGGPFDVFHQFAAILRANPSLVARYNALKTRFDGRPMDAYRIAKVAFIEEVLKDAACLGASGSEYLDDS